MFGIERKIEMVDESNAVIHRRFVTPLFYVCLKPKTAVFVVRRSKSRAIVIPFLFAATVDFCQKKGHVNEVGFWEGYLCDELKSVRNSYERWVKA